MKNLLVILMLTVSTSSFAKVLIVGMINDLIDHSSIMHSDTAPCNGTIESVELLKKIPFNSKYKNKLGVFVKINNKEEPWVCSGLLFTSPNEKEGLKLKASIGKTIKVDKVVKSKIKSIRGFNLGAVTKYSVK